MNEKFLEILTKYLDKVGGFVEKAIDLAIEEVPKVIQEYLAWYMIDYIITFIIFLMFLCLALFFIYKSHKVLKESDCMYDDNNIGWFLLITFSTLSVLPLFFGVLCNGKNALKIYVAPRVFLIERAGELMNEKR